jgi:hypothetical protein
LKCLLRSRSSSDRSRAAGSRSLNTPKACVGRQDTGSSSAVGTTFAPNSAASTP